MALTSGCVCGCGLLGQIIDRVDWNAPQLKGKKCSTGHNWKGKKVDPGRFVQIIHF